MWTMVQQFLHVSDLILILHRIRMLVHPRNLLKHCHSRSRHEVEPRSASDQFNEESDESRIPSAKPKKHWDKSKHKTRSRYVSSSSEDDQSSVARHRSSKPSGAQPSGAVSDQDQPQHDPDPPYYREVALSDTPSQYAEEVDTFRRILSLPCRFSVRVMQLQSDGLMLNIGQELVPFDQFIKERHTSRLCVRL